METTFSHLIDGELVAGRQHFDVMNPATGAPIPRDVLREDEKARVTLVRKPLGPVAAITPWNYPVATLVMKLGPALLTGNTVVAKPSPFTPLSSLALGAALRAAVPKGVVNVLG